MTRTALALVLAALLTGCAAKWYLQQPMLLDEYATARVRIYHTAMQCRIEVTTATATIHTVPTRCVTVPLRPHP